MHLARFEREAESFSAALERERYLHQAGLTPELNTRSIYRQYEETWSPETFALLSDQPLDAKPLRFLRTFIAMNILEARTAGTADDVAEAEAGATVTWLGVDLAYRSAWIAQAVEPDLGRRHALNELVRSQLRQHEVIGLERLRGLRDLATELGYADGVDLHRDLRALDESTLAGFAQTLLRDTRDAYDRALAEQLVGHEMDGVEVWEVDLAWIFRGAEHDRLFPARSLVPTLIRTIADLGLRLEEQDNLRLDVELRPTKSPEPFCAPIAVPHEVIAVVAPRGGIADLAALLDQVGRAEQFACADASQSFEFRRLGDAGVVDSYALLLSSLLANPEWLRWRLEIDDPTEVARLASFRRLFELRLAAVRFEYEREVYRAEEPRDFPERYADLFEQALGARFFAEGYLASVDGRLSAADVLRGAILETQLRRFLEQEYDEAWFRSPRAGRFLLDRWREGKRYTVEEMSRFLGFEQFAVEPLIEDLCAGLAR